MPEVRAVRSVARPLEQVWPVVEDIDRWAPCMPGYVAHTREDARNSTWTLQGDLGPFSRQVRLRVEITTWEAPHRVAFTLDGLDEAVHGEGAFALTGTRPELPPPAPRPWWRRLLDLFFGRSVQAPALPDAAGTTHVVFDFSVQALGPMGPMIDALLGPWSEHVAQRLLEDVGALVERT